MSETGPDRAGPGRAFFCREGVNMMFVSFAHEELGGGVKRYVRLNCLNLTYINKRVNNMCVFCKGTKCVLLCHGVLIWWWVSVCSRVQLLLGEL